MGDLFEKLMQLEEDRYDPEKNLRSKVIDMFYSEGFSFEDEQKAVTGTHLQFRKGDAIVKVFIES